ncbi:MAG: hypothetical protein JEZ12_23485 [Desulfobacterium sp.]|nr:hypothetical protein [Desulfobacterium sp.]
MSHEIETTEEFEERGGVIERLPRSLGFEVEPVGPQGVAMGEGCYWVSSGGGES